MIPTEDQTGVGNVWEQSVTEDEHEPAGGPAAEEEAIEEAEAIRERNDSGRGLEAAAMANQVLPNPDFGGAGNYRLEDHDSANGSARVGQEVEDGLAQGGQEGQVAQDEGQEGEESTNREADALRLERCMGCRVSYLICSTQSFIF
jgi:hypothetical protein